MKKGLIWGTGKIFNDTITVIKYHQNRGNFEIKAVTSKEPNVYMITLVFQKKILILMIMILL